MNSSDLYYYETEETADPNEPEWHVWRKREEDPLGMIRRDRGNNYEVKRAGCDKAYHSSFPTRGEAAAWLSDHETDPAKFPNETEDEDEE